MTPDFIPHKYFHKGSWLINDHNPDWYYFYPHRNNKFNYDKKFYTTLDSQLKKVVEFLHSINLNTTPSCAGHFYPEKSFEKIFNGLKNQKDIINNKGLVLQNPETGEFYKYKNSNYNLPWDKDTFIEKGEEYQKMGCLGIKISNNIIGDILLNNPIKGFKNLHDKKDNVMVFLTKSNSAKERDQKWGYFTDKINNLF